MTAAWPARPWRTSLGVLRRAPRYARCLPRPAGRTVAAATGVRRAPRAATVAPGQRSGPGERAWSHALRLELLPGRAFARPEGVDQRARVTPPGQSVMSGAPTREQVMHRL